MNPQVTVTTNVKLTIKGQEIEMSMEELRSLYAEIGKALGVNSKDGMIEMLKKLEEIRDENHKRRPKERPFYTPQWPPFDEAWLKRKNPLDPPWDVTCILSKEDSANALAVARKACGLP